ncbi:MAG TPA: hypothetical protein VF886_02480, partial [Roseiarcus sp.]
MLTSRADTDRPRLAYCASELGSGQGARTPRRRQESGGRPGGGVAHLISVILTLNAGSSSLKFAAFRLAEGAELTPLASGQIEGLGATARGEIETEAGKKTVIAFNPSDGPADHHAAMRAILGWLDKAGYAGSIAAVGHRVVHGGADLVEPALIDEPTLAKLRAL